MPAPATGTGNADPGATCTAGDPAGATTPEPEPSEEEDAGAGLAVPGGCDVSGEFDGGALPPLSAHGDGLGPAGRLPFGSCCRRGAVHGVVELPGTGSASGSTFASGSCDTATPGLFAGGAIRCALVTSRPSTARRDGTGNRDRTGSGVAGASAFLPHRFRRVLDRASIPLCASFSQSSPVPNLYTIPSAGNPRE